MGIKLSELKEGSPVILLVSNKDKSMPLEAVISKHVKNNIAYITLDDSIQKTLIFDGVQIDLEYHEEGTVPIIWHNVKIITYKSNYVLQVFTDGTRHNRRSFFRVGVSATAQILSSSASNGPRQIMVRDISLSGFSVSDRKKELNLNIGDQLSIYFEDLGHMLSLIGKVVRVEKQEEVIIYGLEICNLCKNLSSYLSTKQRQKKNNK